MKVQAIKSFRELEGVFQDGDVLFLEVIRARPKRPTLSRKKKGRFIDYSVTNSENRTYSGKFIKTKIGTKPLNELFKRIDNYE